MRCWPVIAATALVLVTSSAAGATRMTSQATTCSVTGASMWTPAINVSHIRPTAISWAATLKCRGGGVLVGVMAGFLRSPKVACVAPPVTTPEGGVLTIQWNTGKSSTVSLKVTFVNSTGHQILSGTVKAGLFAGDAVKLDIQAKTAVGRCTNASPLVSNTFAGSITL